MLLSGAWGKVIHEKNLKQKISWHCPFKGRLDYVESLIDCAVHRVPGKLYPDLTQLNTLHYVPPPFGPPSTDASTKPVYDNLSLFLEDLPCFVCFTF